jgi:pyruvate,water dikinase
MRPSDPHEFADLLGGTNMASIQRNEMLAQLAEAIRRNPVLERQLRNPDDATLDADFEALLNTFMDTFGEFTFSGAHSGKNRRHIIDLVLEMASREPVKKRFEPDRVKRLTEEFLSRFTDEKKEFAADLLDLGRASYRLRDDDNIYLGRIESHVHTAVREGRDRITARGHFNAARLEPREVARALTDSSYRPREAKASDAAGRQRKLRARQLLGQPAGPGIGTGTARVVTSPSDLFDFKAGEILVCDSIDPNMTFIVPLAAGIVERRGGMLIHGAIVAREYGIPCVTGVPDAPSLIHNGQQVTVDGFLGIVVIGKPTLSRESPTGGLSEA